MGAQEFADHMLCDTVPPALTPAPGRPIVNCRPIISQAKDAQDEEEWKAI